MSTLGNSTTPASGWDWPGTGGWAGATEYTTPAGGGILISALHGYLANVSGQAAGTGYLCVWSSGGTLLASVNIGTLANTNGSTGPNALTWYSGTLATPLYVAGNTAIWIGFYNTSALYFDTEAGGVNSSVKSMGSGGPGSFSGATSTGFGAVGAYVDYTNAGAWVYNGSAWVAAPVQVWNGSAWVAAEADVYSGTVWNPGQ